MLVGNAGARGGAAVGGEVGPRRSKASSTEEGRGGADQKWHWEEGGNGGDEVGRDYRKKPGSGVTIDDGDEVERRKGGSSLWPRGRMRSLRKMTRQREKADRAGRHRRELDDGDSGRHMIEEEGSGHAPRCMVCGCV